MKPEPETISLAEYRRLTQAQPRKRAKRAPRADIPRAAPSERIGLDPLMRRGWSGTYDVRYGHRLYELRGQRRSTAWHADEKAACAEAKQMDAQEL